MDNKIKIKVKVQAEKKDFDIAKMIIEFICSLPELTAKKIFKQVVFWVIPEDVNAFLIPTILNKEIKAHIVFKDRVRNSPRIMAHEIAHFIKRHHEKVDDSTPFGTVASAKLEQETEELATTLLNNWLEGNHSKSENR